MTRGKERHFAIAFMICAVMGGVSFARTASAQDKNSNIVVIMGDDIGMWNLGAYHRAAF